ncbi:SRPBCC family protein [Leptospira ilyithenensis]|uniref:Activator of Hsp90 ATPase homologue 1/2-like C-terminal domain-containing protein n=1 Tax=Leptospira ilyithenensis TaxID=2484901 RepID=A0A4R9LNP3_9LEPT|nr:SRPBCC domain-containing protein [Leptospira ilyithenensis]TGN08289.1 hypothetical protein EHS11_15350 [Leptospira ilyithenensis]
MDFSFIETKILIHAKPSTVWEVFTNPILTRQMGGEYVTNWKQGSSFGWKGLDGKMLTRGKILEIEPDSYFKHSLFETIASEEGDSPIINSVITYRFEKEDEFTELIGREDFKVPINQKEYENIRSGWKLALEAVKATAEAADRKT